MNRRAGITLIELMVSVVIVVILTTAITRAFVIGLTYEARVAQARARQEAKNDLEDRLIDLFQHAYLSPDDTNTDTFFIGGAEGDTGIGTGLADTMQFTVQGARPPSVLVESTDDFETQNETYGPQGGVAEIALSMTPVGEAPTNTGLFIRTQRPSDSEPTQGGNEAVFDAGITSIEFEFWDGTTWQPAWSTLVGAEKRLPAAVRITYSREGEPEDRPHVLIVRIPVSDVTADNPAQQTAPGGNL